MIRNEWRKDVKNRVIRNRKKLLVWMLAALVCMLASVIAWHVQPNNSTEIQFFHSVWDPHGEKLETLELHPGEELVQSFTAMGNIVGGGHALNLKMDPKTQKQPFRIQAVIRLVSEEEPLAVVGKTVSELGKDGVIELPFEETVWITSGEKYSLTISNPGTEALQLVSDSSVQSGTLTLEGQKLDGVLKFGFYRTSMYSVSKLTRLLTLLTVLTVLTGLTLVLFTNAKEHMLYLVLAVGFGVVTLFDQTALYGFDMRFQFDSAYVVSNELLGLDGVIYAPSGDKPGQNTVHYYRRAGDDYTQFQFYFDTNVADNYVDMKTAIYHPFADAEDCELILAEANQKIVSGQLRILYFPQAVGFTIARLLGLGFLPMVQLGRIVTYAVFVLLAFFAIRCVPFGKRLFMILSLSPAVMSMTVSITRDAVVLALSFFVTAKVLQMAYQERQPNVLDWVSVIGASALLAPCKAVYLPVSLFWLLIVFRRFLCSGRRDWKKAGFYVAAGMIPILIVMLFAANIHILDILVGFFKQKSGEISTAASAGQVESAAEAWSAPVYYTFSMILSQLPRVCLIFWNTMREQFIEIVINAIQLTAIGLGSDEMMTLLMFALLFGECFCQEEGRQVLQPAGRMYSGALALGVLLLTSLGALTWTEVGSTTIAGLQGRYLTPVLPLACVSMMNSRRIRVRGNVEHFVKACCCIFPAIYLMNMYLWTVGGSLL